MAIDWSTPRNLASVLTQITLRERGKGRPRAQTATETNPDDRRLRTWSFLLDPNAIRILHLFVAF